MARVNLPNAVSDIRTKVYSTGTPVSGEMMKTEGAAAN